MCAFTKYINQSCFTGCVSRGAFPLRFHKRSRCAGSGLSESSGGASMSPRIAIGQVCVPAPPPLSRGRGRGCCESTGHTWASRDSRDRCHGALFRKGPTLRVWRLRSVVRCQIRITAPDGIRVGVPLTDATAFRLVFPNPFDHPPSPPPGHGQPWGRFWP